MSNSDLDPAREIDEAASTTNKVRQGVTGHNVRYVLFFAIAGAVLGLVLLYALFFN